MRTTSGILLILLTFVLNVSAQSYDIRIYDDAAGLSHNHATRVLQDRNGFIWVATWNGLNRFDGIEFDTFKVQPGDGNEVSNDRIRDFFVDSDGTFLCLVHETIYRFDPRTYRFSSVSPDIQRTARQRMERERTSANGMPHSRVIGQTQFDGVHHEVTDAQGSMWLVGRNCIIKAVKRQQPYTMVDEVQHEIVRCMYQDRQGRIWVATKDNGNGEVAAFDADMNLLGYLGRDGQLHRQHTPFADVYCILHDSKDQIWFGTKPDGMFRLKLSSNSPKASKSQGLNTLTPQNLEHFLTDKTFYDIKEDAHGNIWLATFDQGICRMASPTSQQMLTNKQIFGKNYPPMCDRVRRIIFRGDTLIASTTVGLIVAYDNHITHHEREANRRESLSCSAIMDVIIDAKGRLLVTTESGGINILQSPSLSADKFEFKHITRNEGLGCDIVNAACIVDGDILLQSNTEMVKFAAGDYSNPICYGRTFWNGNFRFSDARPLQLRDGRLLVSLEDGVFTVPYSRLTDTTFVPRLAITRISMNDGTTLWEADHMDTLRLNPDQRNIAVKFAALDYRTEGNIRYATRFDEASDWTILSATREITLYDLTPGTHTLELRSTNAEGIWTDNVRCLTIIVEPQFHETATAKTLLILLFALIVASITYTYIYIRNIKRQRQETLEAYLSLIESYNKEEGKSDDSAPSAPKITAEDEAFMQRLMNFVEQNIGNSEATIDEMADATATSRSSLNRKTKSLLGVTPADFLKEARLKHAAQLLRSTADTTSNIAYLCGFSDPKYFSKCFKASYGMSPKDYKAQTDTATK